ncbi:MAG TPA: hypothetical protein VK066_03510 [Chloroflexota bacterium]|nr:hypothetical protein [Chloroflexota bacterium]
MADDAARDALEQRFAEQLLDDEGLRADLTDDEYQPLQDWALDRLHERVVALADPGAPEAETAMASLLASLRQVLRAVDATVGRRADLDAEAFAAGLAPLVEAVAPPLFGAEGPASEVRQNVQAAIPRLAAQKDDLDGPALVEQLVAVLSGPGGAGGPDRDGVVGPS